MRRTLCSLILSGLLFTAFAQESSYTLKSDISYYPDSIQMHDVYMQQRCKLDVYAPEGKMNMPVVVWFHGGGLTSGTKEIPTELMNQGFCVVGVEYRLSPKVKAPEYIKDAAAAVAWVFNNISKFGGDNSLVFVAGHSAGGYLTCMIGLDKQWLKAYGIDANRIAGLIPFSPQVITHFTIRAERGISEKQPIIDQYAPLFYVRADAPPLLLITGDRELEMLGRYEENAYMMRMMKIAGHTQTQLYEMKGYGHNEMIPSSFPLLLKEVKRITAERKAHAFRFQ